jgi:TolB-like protein
MAIWSAEIKELERLYESLKGQLPDLEKELERLIRTDDENMILLYSRRCLEVIITDLCECELKRPRKTEPLKGIIDKLHKEEKVPSHIISSMLGLNELSTYGAHPKDFDPEQVKPVLVNLDIIIKWYFKYKKFQIVAKPSPEGEKYESKHPLANSIIVLPFENISPDPDQEYFSDGLTEEIITDLSHINDLLVISRSSAMTFKGTKKRIGEIAEEVNVHYVLEGSVRKAGNNLRITAQLIDGINDSHIWAEKYNGTLDDVFDIQGKVSGSIANELKIKLSFSEKKKIHEKPIDNVFVYDCYKRAYPEMMSMSLERLENGLNLLQKGLDIAGENAVIYAGMAFGYFQYVNLGVDHEKIL